MRKFLLAVSIAALAACSQPPAETAAATPPAETIPTTAPGPSAGIDGWEIDMTAYGQIGSAVPAFSVKQPDGSDATPEAMRGHWTILGLLPATGRPADESTFVAALNSAVDQDPELDLLVVQPAPAGAKPVWPVVYDDGSIARAIAAPSLPAYLLIGPDLTIEGYRGALTATPDDGIKSVIKGVAEIRKQVAAPQ